MTIDINHSIELSQFIPNDITLVSESGIQSSADLKRLQTAGINAALIGEYFMKSKQPGLALKQLIESLSNAL
ncbi:MAG: hypothetical protein HYZ34_15310 [Ignavibacteriae bacterium]|nr:hypothetical protein [Ignavibacteriota bacterium]